MAMCRSLERMNGSSLPTVGLGGLGGGVWVDERGRGQRGGDLLRHTIAL